MSISICIVIIALLTPFQEEVLAQAFPPYGGYPIPYHTNNNDDDIGILLAILLLAGRNRNNGCGCSCCNCCNCGNSAQNYPIPFPIPFPTNNPIVNKGCQNSDFDYYEDTPKVKSKKGAQNNIYIDLTELDDD